MQKATLPAYRQLVIDQADRFANGDFIHAQDLAPLSDDDLAVILNHEDAIGYDAPRPSAWADILNSAVHVTHEERSRALGICLRDALLKEARDYLCQDVNTELASRDTTPVEIPDMPATEAPWDRPQMVEA